MSTGPNSRTLRTTNGQVHTAVCTDSGNPLEVVLTDNTASDKQSHYGEVTSVASAVSTTIVSLTIPASKTFLLREVEVGGTNIATFSVEIASTLEAKKRTYFTHYNERFNFHGLEVATGVTIDVKVIHSRSATGDFEARIIGDEI